MAWHFVKYGKGYEGLREIEKGARLSKLGLWQDSEPMPPWDWRKAKTSAPRSNATY